MGWDGRPCPPEIMVKKWIRLRMWRNLSFELENLLCCLLLAKAQRKGLQASCTCLPFPYYNDQPSQVLARNNDIPTLFKSVVVKWGVSTLLVVEESALTVSLRLNLNSCNSQSSPFPQFIFYCWGPSAWYDYCDCDCDSYSFLAPIIHIINTTLLWCEFIFFSSHLIPSHSVGCCDFCVRLRLRLQCSLYLLPLLLLPSQCHYDC